jgi:hypothetical protein
LGEIQIDVTEVAKLKRAQSRDARGRYPGSLDFEVKIDVLMSSNKGILEVVAKAARKEVGSAEIVYSAVPVWQQFPAAQNEVIEEEEEAVVEADD